VTSRRSLLALLVLAVLLIGVALAGCINSSAHQAIPLSWNLNEQEGGMNSGLGQHHPFDPTQAGTMTSLEVHVGAWPASEVPADAWLTQEVAYGSDTVTITLRMRGTDVSSTALPTVGGYDTGGWVTVALSEPLRSRNLVDGATGKVVPYPSAP
jgi:hypothetical protein